MTGKILLARKYQAISSVKQQLDNFILAGVTAHLNLRPDGYFYKVLQARSNIYS